MFNVISSRYGCHVGDDLGQPRPNGSQSGRCFTHPSFYFRSRTLSQNDRLSVHFFSVAFLGFMSVAGIPAFLEERQVFMRERLNGLYGPGAYVLANSIVSLPYLFMCSLLFSVLAYWSIGLHPGAGHFFRFLGILFLAVYTAESQVSVMFSDDGSVRRRSFQCMVVAAAIPIFVAALAIASFLNGFWMVGSPFLRTYAHLVLTRPDLSPSAGTSSAR